MIWITGSTLHPPCTHLHSHANKRFAQVEYPSRQDTYPGLRTLEFLHERIFNALGLT